jgi:hypothetical protein
MAKKDDVDSSYFEHDKDVSLNKSDSIKPYLLRSSVILPLVILVVLTVGSFLLLNTL